MSDPTSRSRYAKDSVESILPDDWHALAPLVDAVLDAPPERRAEVLAQVSAGDPARRAAVERLVAECEADTPMLDRPAAERFARLLVGDDEPELPETLGGRYRIVRELGRGGMARVYLARDTKHARDVAVKVIRPDLAASLGRDRFLREIGIAARLRHPNIVPVYDSGDADGLLYFVMPYEEGESLRERLTRAQRPPVAECVSALRDVARALVYAHEHGVVHRDVKPDNVMMSGGAAVVTDFGIAKAVSVAQADSPAGTITQTGAGIGTPAYMAPEQAIGDPSTDHRADIYSFGCLAYELFAGHPPFHGLPTHQIIAAHVGTKPVPLPRVAAEVPDMVAELVARCLEKDPAARPQQAQELLTALEGSQTGPVDAVRRRRRWRASRHVPLVLAGVLVLSAAGYLVARTRASAATPARDELTLAVLPFLSYGGDSTQSDMAAGFSDELATALFNVPGVQVRSRGTVGKYRGVTEFDAQKVGQELGVRMLVAGTLRRNANGLTVSATLYAARDGEPLWRQNFDRSTRELTEVREEIARSIERTLRSRFRMPTDLPAVARQPERAVDPEAYRLYLLAQGALNRRGQSIRASADLFRRAAQIDTAYARAYSGLSLALALTPYFHPTPTSEVEAEAIATAERALRLDPTLAQPHVALGVVYQHAFDWDRAATEHETAVRLRTPDDVEPLVQYGRHLLFRGRIDEGLKQFLLARKTEPASALVSSWVAYGYYLSGQIDSAVVESQRAFQNDSTNITTLTLGTLIRLKAGRLEEARQIAERIRIPRSPLLFYALAAMGDTAGIRKRSAELVDSTGQSLWFSEASRAYLALGRGDTARALTALERATDLQQHWPSHVSVLDPLFDSIRGTDRFRALLRRVGLPELATPAAARQPSR